MKKERVTESFREIKREREIDRTKGQKDREKHKYVYIKRATE